MAQGECIVLAKLRAPNEVAVLVFRQGVRDSGDAVGVLFKLLDRGA